MRLPLRLLLLNLSLILLTFNVHAQDNLGHDLLAAQQGHFNFKKAARYAPENSALGSLDFTFGTDLTPIRYLLSQGNYKLYRVHLINAVCVRNRNCGQYEVGAGYTISSFSKAIENRNRKIIRHVRTRTAEYKRLSQDYSQTKVWVSPALEHNLTPKAYRVLADEVKNVWPEVQLVNSEQNCQGERYRGALRECHGNTSSGDISSLDGTDVTDIDVVEWLKKTRFQKLRFVWSRSYNCRTQGAFLDPRARTACPKEYQFEELAHITDVRPPAPARTGIFVACKDLNSPYKQFAEDKASGDPRANLPVLLVPGNKNPFNVFAVDGTNLGALTYYGVFSGNTAWNRYYSGHIGGSKKNGYQFEKEATPHGSPWVYAKQGSKCYGPFVPGRRAGSYRD